jgi:hypothetical protein
MKLESASKTNHTRVSSHSKTPLGVGTSHEHFDSQNSPRPGLGGSHHLPPYNILCATPRGLHPNGTFSRDSQVGGPKLFRNCPEIVPVRVRGLWELITSDCGVWSQQNLNQSYSPCWDLFNAVLHFQFGLREKVDFWLLVVGSQTASLTPGPSFAHNLSCRCPNDQWEGILNIYNSRPFYWHKKHFNARCFGLCCRTLNIQESRRTPNPQPWEWDRVSSSHFTQSGVATRLFSKASNI